MESDFSLPVLLADTPTLLVSGGDERIVPDPASGLTQYGCKSSPDPSLVALGSSTASIISEPAFAAAEALRLACLAQLRHQSIRAVYAMQTRRLRAELLELCGFHAADGVGALLAASGTDLHMLAAQCLRPARTVMIAPEETGSGVAPAMRGLHFCASTAYGGKVERGSAVSDWQGEVASIAVRESDGSLREAGAINADCTSYVNEAARAGQSVLLVLTDASKTGLVVPSVETAMALRRRWPRQVQVLVDACQFRLAPSTVRAYVAHGFMVALTGSKFLTGPTFCGALLLPRGASARFHERPQGGGLEAYSCAADWPPACRFGRALPQASNFGLLLRWEAALCELRRFYAVPSTQVRTYLRIFGGAVRACLDDDAFLEALPVAPMLRQALDEEPDWDAEQSIFPFLLMKQGLDGGRRYLSRQETLVVYRSLLMAPTASRPRRFQLGQPVACGERDGVPASALRICVGARMISAAHESGTGASVENDLNDVRAALAAIRRAVAAL